MSDPSVVYFRSPCRKRRDCTHLRTFSPERGKKAQSQWAAAYRPQSKTKRQTQNCHTLGSSEPWPVHTRVHTEEEDCQPEPSSPCHQACRDPVSASQSSLFHWGSGPLLRTDRSSPNRTVSDGIRCPPDSRASSRTMLPLSAPACKASAPCGHLVRPLSSLCVLRAPYHPGHPLLPYVFKHRFSRELFPHLPEPARQPQMYPLRSQTKAINFHRVSSQLGPVSMLWCRGSRSARNGCAAQD